MAATAENIERLRRLRSLLRDRQDKIEADAEVTAALLRDPVDEEERARRRTPQPGPQTDFLNSTADITIMGGAAGGGKSYGLLLDVLRHIENPGFGAVVFRRTLADVKKEGSLWDTSLPLFGGMGAHPQKAHLAWRFPTGARLTFGHLEHDDTVLDWQGAQIAMIGFDELTHFTRAQFFYMLSRNRSTSGVKPYVKATCNADSESWVRELIAWWINPDTGFAIPERSGVIRWFARINDTLVWGDAAEEIKALYPDAEPKSLTFIPAALDDNKILMRIDPAYRANLMALNVVERERLLKGNWKIRWSGQAFFDIENLLVGGAPVPMPIRCEAVFAIVDSATKTGKKRDGTSATYFAIRRTERGDAPIASANPRFVIPDRRLMVLDWDIRQIEGALLEAWLPTVFQRLEHLASECRARAGSLGVMIEDKSSGMVLIQQSQRRGWPATAIDSKLTAMGKDERALSISGYYELGLVKIVKPAYEKVVTYKETTRNHLTGQLEQFRIGDETPNREDDLLDGFCYGVAVAFGNPEGF